MWVVVGGRMRRSCRVFQRPENSCRPQLPKYGEGPENTAL